MKNSNPLQEVKETAKYGWNKGMVLIGAPAVIASSAVILLVVIGLALVIWYWLTKPLANILKEKYAAGEISKKEFDNLKKMLWWNYRRT